MRKGEGNLSQVSVNAFAATARGTTPTHVSLKINNVTNVAKWGTVNEYVRVNKVVRYTKWIHL